MKTIYRLIILLGISGLLFVSCEDFLDINEDPGVPTSGEVTEAVYLPGVLGRWAYNGVSQISIDKMYMNLQLTREGASVGGGLWGNYVTPSNSGAPWGLYTSLLNHAMFLQNLAIKNGNPHYQGIAEVIAAWSLATLTDFYGPVPAEEAIRFPEITQPKFDTQEQVYTRVFSMLDAAIANLGTAPGQQSRAVGRDDLVFSGDMEKWRKLAHSLKARYQMRLTYAPGKSATAQADAVLAALGNGMKSNADDALFRHFTGTGFQSGYFEFGRNWTDVQALTPSPFLVNAMLAQDDPRLPIYFTTDIDGGYSGWVSGIMFDPARRPSRIATTFIGPTYPETFMNFVECKFLEAEAYALKGMWTQAENAFKEAVTANMTKLGAGSEAISTFLAQFTFPQNVEQAQEMLMLQKYISNYMTNFEMHFDFIRTGYPKMNFAQNIDGAASATTVPRRFPYPNSEKDRNPNTPENTFNPLTTKVWWDNK
jgi:hypothetical protein